MFIGFSNNPEQINQITQKINNNNIKKHLFLGYFMKYLSHTIKSVTSTYQSINSRIKEALFSRQKIRNLEIEISCLNTDLQFAQGQTRASQQDAITARQNLAALKTEHHKTAKELGQTYATLAGQKQTTASLREQLEQAQLSFQRTRILHQIRRFQYEKTHAELEKNLALTQGGVGNLKKTIRLLKDRLEDALENTDASWKSFLRLPEVKKLSIGIVKLYSGEIIGQTAFSRKEQGDLKRRKIQDFVYEDNPRRGMFFGVRLGDDKPWDCYVVPIRGKKGFEYGAVYFLQKSMLERFGIRTQNLTNELNKASIEVYRTMMDWAKKRGLNPEDVFLAPNNTNVASSP